MSISVPRTDWMLLRLSSTSRKDFTKQSCRSLLEGSPISLLAVEMILGMAEVKQKGH